MDATTRATHQAALAGLACLPSDAREDVRRYHAARDARAAARAALDAALVTRDPRTIERACEEHGAAVGQRDRTGTTGRLEIHRHVPAPVRTNW